MYDVTVRAAHLVLAEARSLVVASVQLLPSNLLEKHVVVESVPARKCDVLGRQGLMRDEALLIFVPRRARVQSIG